MSLLIPATANLWQKGSPWFYTLPDPTATGLSGNFLFPGSIGNTPLPMSPQLHPASATIVGNFVNSNAVALTWDRGAARYNVRGNTCPKFTLHVNPNSRWSNPNTGPATLPHPYSPGIRPNTSTTDHQVIINDLDAQISYNMWVVSNNHYTYPDTQGMKDATGQLVSNPDGSWTCNTIQVVPTDGSYSGIGLWAGDPTGLSSTSSAAGTPFELEQVTLADALYVQNGGSIQHFITCAVTQTGASVWPADAYDGTWAAGSPGSVPEGVLLTWGPSAVKPTGLSLLASAIYDAIGNYGLMVVDMTAGSGTSVGFENLYPWLLYAPGAGGPQLFQPYLSGLINWLTNEDYQGRPILPASFPWSDLVAITPRTTDGWINNRALPGAPTGLSASFTGANVTLNWTAPGSFGFGAATGYYVFAGTASGVYPPMGYNGGNAGNGSGTMIVSTNASTTTITLSHDAFENAFVNGTRYYFIVCACSASGMGPASNEANAVAA